MHDNFAAPTMQSVKVGVIGLGYFSQFHLSAWESIDTVSLKGVCDLDRKVVDKVAQQFSCEGFTDIEQMLASNEFDIIDIVTPPPAHRHIIEKTVKKGRLLICQKPFCESLEEAFTMVESAKAAETTLLVHENFRFQPWYRAIKDQLAAGLLGNVYQARFSLRPGDGRGRDAYLSRQPAFQTMPQLLLHETGVHFIDVFRWLFGEVSAVYADIRKLNPVISGEDAGVLILDHHCGMQTIFDGNRLADHASDNSRRTMGELLIEGEKGTLRLDGYGKLYFRAFTEKSERAITLDYAVDESSFGGGCVAALINHACNAFVGDRQFENTAEEYLNIIRLKNAAYESANKHRKIFLEKGK